MKRCPHTRCPNLIPRSARYCPEHAVDYETRRGSRQARGYGASHDRERTRIAHLVEHLQAHCAKCGLIVLPTESWDLGHNEDRTRWTGAEHARCNRSDGGRKGAKLRNQNDF